MGPYLCSPQQVGEDRKPVGCELLQLQGDDGQGQCGALELPELVASHTVLYLPGPQHRLAARGRLLRMLPVPGGGGQVRVGGDQQGVELQEQQEELEELKVSKVYQLLQSLLTDEPQALPPAPPSTTELMD